MTEIYRIGWLDSCRMNSKIHATMDKENTICGHSFLEKHRTKRWIIQRVPTKSRGSSRYCKTCFKNGNKNSKWLTEENK